jgi:hypothetical protein
LHRIRAECVAITWARGPESSINGAISTAHWSSANGPDRKTADLRGFCKPSDGLEPSTPSLPWRFWGVTCVHARSLATQFLLQMRLVRTLEMRRETSRVSFLMCPFCVRALVPSKTTYVDAPSASIPPPSRNHRTPTAADTPAAAGRLLARDAASIARQNRCRHASRAIDGRPGDRIRGRSARSAARCRACPKRNPPHRGVATIS